MENKEKKLELKDPTIYQTNENCQVFNGPISGCVFAMPGATVNQSPAQHVHQNTRTKKSKEHCQPTPRETMTFGKKGGVVDGHLSLLYGKLTKEKWIEGSEEDFKALFSGKRNGSCMLTWMEPFGKAALFALFKELNREGLISVPDGCGISAILEGHFKDKSGRWLSGLDKGNKPHSKALTVIKECVTLLSLEHGGARMTDNPDGDDFRSVYDPFDHQDLHLHRR